jgi:hypothetical protein
MPTYPSLDAYNLKYLLHKLGIKSAQISPGEHLNPMLKQMYSGTKLDSLIFDNNPFLALLPKDSDDHKT